MIPAHLTGKPDKGEAPVRVLLAEDNFLLRLDAADSVRRLGWNVIEVSSADEAMELLRYGVHFDLLLTDVDMPGRANGLDLARNVRSHHPRMKIAIMSGSTRHVADPQLCDLFLRKPVWNVADLLLGLMEGARDAD